MIRGRSLLRLKSGVPGRKQVRTLRRGPGSNRQQPQDRPLHSRGHTQARTHTYAQSLARHMQCRILGERHVPRGPTRGGWQGTCVGLGGVGWLGKLSDRRELCRTGHPQPQAFHFNSVTSLRCSWAVGRAPSQARVHFCAPPASPQ